MIRRFDQFFDEALYGDAGFYSGVGRAGLDDGDFITSVETSTLFGECIAGWLDEAWHDLGRPDPFVVVEGGAGPGRLCRDVMLGADRCRHAIRYVMVERSAAQSELAFARVVEECFAGVDEVPVVAVADLPGGPFDGVVLANELLDNLAPRLLERSDDGWSELYVDEGEFVRQRAPAPAAAMADALAPDASVGSCVPLQLKATVWVQRALGLLSSGRVLLFDYGTPRSSDFATRPLEEWLRAYRSHRRGVDVLADPGSQDITCDVAFDQLPAGAQLSTQRDWLLGHGLEDLIAEDRRRWERTAAAPDAASLAARLRVDEAAQLTARGGLGDFQVAEWRV